MGSNADTIRKLYEAFGTGDVATVLGAMDDKIDWQEPESLPFENQVGPQAVAENIFGAVMSMLDGFAVVPNEIADGGDVVCGIGVYKGTGKETGVELDADFVHVWHFGSDGKITGFRTYTDTHLWRQALGVS